VKFLLKSKKITPALLAIVILSLLLIGFVLFALPAPKNPQHSIFVYGTLQNELIRNSVCLCDARVTPVTLEGYQKTGLNIVSDDNATVEGKIIYVDDIHLERFDKYEDVPTNYIRSEIVINGAKHWVYIKQ